MQYKTDIAVKNQDTFQTKLQVFAIEFCTDNFKMEISFLQLHAILHPKCTTHTFFSWY